MVVLLGQPVVKVGGSAVGTGMGSAVGAGVGPVQDTELIVKMWPMPLLPPWAATAG